jgi:hypothetical protein
MTAIAVHENVQFCAELVYTVLLITFRLSLRGAELMVESCLSASFIVGSCKCVRCIYYYYYYCVRYRLLLLSPPLCRVFTIIYLQQTMFLLYAVLQLFHIYSLCYTQCYFAHEICFLLLHYHFPQYVCSAKYGCFL